MHTVAVTRRRGPVAGPGRRGGLTIFGVDAATLDVQLLAESWLATAPLFCLAQPDGLIYVTSDDDDGSTVLVCRFEANGVIRPLQRQPTFGTGASYLATAAHGRHLYVTNLNVRPDRPGKIVTSYDISAGGHLSRRETDFLPATWTGRGSMGHSVITVVGGLVLVADRGRDRLLVMRSHDDGAPLEALSVVDLPEGAGPRHMAASPDGSRVYVVNEADATLASFLVDVSSGGLAATGVVKTTLAACRDRHKPADVVVSGCGRFVYVCNRGLNNIVAFAESGNAGLEGIAQIASGGSGPRCLALSSSGEHLFCVNEDADNVAIMSVDTSTGSIRDTKLRIFVTAPTWASVIS